MKKKSTLLLISFLLYLFSINAYAELFKCELNLNVIEDTSSSELKSLALEVEINPGNKNVMTGAMTSTTCYNTIVDPFSTETLEFKKLPIGNWLHGTLHAHQLEVGRYHYNLTLSFAQAPGQVAGNVIKLVADGKILPLDNEYYIHQNIEGSCTLSEDPEIAPKSLSVPDMGCGN